MNIPKGKLISVGGSEDKGTEIDAKFVQKDQL
ncbi:MAG: hypothetical protein K0S44_431, partial [Bacteroidetes bacterium]|nr:hypothetical protein [Bacteroidota bacterium]